MASLVVQLQSRKNGRCLGKGWRRRQKTRRKDSCRTCGKSGVKGGSQELFQRQQMMRTSREEEDGRGLVKYRGVCVI